jgi:hypothetical protein
MQTAFRALLFFLLMAAPFSPDAPAPPGALACTIGSDDAVSGTMTLRDINGTTLVNSFGTEGALTIEAGCRGIRQLRAGGGPLYKDLHHR